MAEVNASLSPFCSACVMAAEYLATSSGSVENARTVRMLLSACTATDPTSRNEKISNTGRMCMPCVVVEREQKSAWVGREGRVGGFTGAVSLSNGGQNVPEDALAPLGVSPSEVDDGADGGKGKDGELP